MSWMLRARTWFAVLFALPISVVAIGSAANIAGDLVNPCVVWGASNSASFDGTANDACKQGKGEGETRLRAVVTIVAVQGVILLAAVLGIWGTVRSRQWIVVLAGCLMIFEAFPLLFSFWPLALLAGVGFFWTAHRASV